MSRCKSRLSQRYRSGKHLAALLCWAGLSGAACAADKPPVSPDPVVPSVAQSSISASIEIGMHALDEALESRVPRRLVSINDRTTECWHKRILGRQIDVDCVYSGYVERVGGIPLRAEGGRLTAATPLFGAMQAQGIGGPLVSRIHGSGEGQMTVFASARPQLRRDWSVALDMSEGFRWTEPPVMTVLGFRIDMTRYIEPQIKKQLSRVQADFEEKVRAIGVRDKAASAWRQAFLTVPLLDDPSVTLQTAPQSMAFSGIRVRNNMLEGSIEMNVTTETTVGGAPPFITPTPLPPLGTDVSEPGQFSLIVPVGIRYDLIRQKLQDAVAARLQNGGLKLQDASVYPSAGKLVAALQLAAAADDGKSDWVYLTATPQLDADGQVLQLADLAFTSDSTAPEGSPLATLLRDPGLIQMLQQQVRLTLKDRMQAIIASANAKLTRPLADGFRSEGNLAAAGLSKIALLPDQVRVEFRASGNLRILYGL